MLLSNSLYPDVTSDDGWDHHKPDDSADLGRDSDNGEDPAGVSSLFGELKRGEHLPCVDVVAFVWDLHMWSGDPVHSWGGIGLRRLSKQTHKAHE